MIPSSAAFLSALGLTDKEGKVKPKRASKLKQCRRFVEVLDAAFCGLQGDGLDVLDMGAGRGYLTFSVYHRLLSLGLAPRVTGVEGRGAVVDEVNEIAGGVGFDGLSFVEGSIDR